MRRSKTHDVMNYYVARVNKDSSSVVKNPMNARALMDAIYNAGMPPAEERCFDRVMMTIEEECERR